MGLNKRIAGGFESTDQLANGMAKLLNIANDLLFSLVTGQPRIKISDNVHTDLTGQVIAGGGGGRGGKGETGNNEKDLKQQQSIEYQNNPDINCFI